MKYIILCAALALVAGIAIAAPTLPRDGDGQKVFSPSWDATLSQSITSTASQNINIAGRLWYEFMASGDCKARLMNNVTKSNWPVFVLKANAPFRGSNDATSTKAKAAYLNVTGCTGDFRAQ